MRHFIFQRIRAPFQQRFSPLKCISTILNEVVYQFNVLDITYEGMFKNIGETMQSISSFLGISGEFVFSTVSKANPFELTEMIENFSDVKGYFKNIEEYGNLFKT